MDDSRYIVVCKDDNGQYVLSTRQTLETKLEAETLAGRISPDRSALVVECDANTVILRKENL